MTTLTGTYIYGLDRKGRLVMPAHFRAVLGSPFMLTRLPGQSLAAFSVEQWEALVRRHGDRTEFQGYYLAAAVRCPVDENTGRFLIPHVLREYLELRRMEEMAISGVETAVVLSTRATWEAALQAGQWPALEALRELGPERPETLQPYQHRVAWHRDIPVVTVEGRLHPRAAGKLARTLAGLLPGVPEALPVVIDLRQAGDVASGWRFTRAACPAAEGRLLWLVTDQRLAPEAGVTLFRDLETVFRTLPPVGRRAPIVEAETLAAVGD